jgi:hypothetical protein
MAFRQVHEYQYEFDRKRSNWHVCVAGTGLALVDQAPAEYTA